MSVQPWARKSRQIPAFARFAPEVVNRLQRVADAYLEEFDEHQAFDYMIAELFETTDEERFIFTDGPNDGGIDFFIQDEMSYSIYQCKCPTVETVESSDTAPSFDKGPVEELVSAVSLLKDEETAYPVRKEITTLRADFQRDLAADPDSTTCTATLAILGELTPPAQKVFEAAKKTLRQEQVALNLITWQKIYEQLYPLESPADVDFRLVLNFDDLEKEVLSHRDYCYLLAYAVDLYQAWREHEWRLFDWNVRLQLHRSKINRKIVKSLVTETTRKIFHHLNNGILITCRNYAIDGTRKKIRLNGPQIVNGCQTVCAIRDAYESLVPQDQKRFAKQARVQVKIIQNVDPEFIGELVITTNDQNPMNPRNLKSNRPEQKHIQKQFREFGKPWFYQRKDGEMESLRSASRRVPWFKKSDYAVRKGKGERGRRRSRVIDNEQLAKNWFACIGYSDRALKGGLDYFGKKELYERIFNQHPNEKFWERFVKDPYFSPADDDFSRGSPSVEQYLLATTVAEFVTAKRVSSRKAKQEARHRGLIQGKLKGDPSTGAILSPEKEIDEFLAQDSEYRLNVMLLNMREILVELVWFLLARRYGALDTAVCKTLLETAQIQAFWSSAFDPALAPSGSHDAKAILGPIYAFGQYCMGQYRIENRAEIESAPRLKAYLWSAGTRTKLRDYFVQEDAQITDLQKPWKPAGQTFIDSLPELA